MNIKRLKTWLCEVWRWTLEAKLAILCCSVLIAAFLFGFYTWHSELSVRRSGYALQMLGMVFTIGGLLNIRAHFDQPPLRKLSAAWLHRFPKWKRDIIIAVGAGHFAVAGMRPRVEVWTPDNPEDSTEKRINGIINNLERLREAQRKSEIMLDEVHENHEKHRKEDALARVSMEQNFRSDLESLHTGDIVTSLIGIVWLTFGLSMSTIPQELLKIVQQWY